MSRQFEVAADRQAWIAISDALYRAAGPGLEDQEPEKFGSACGVPIQGRAEPLTVRFD